VTSRRWRPLGALALVVAAGAVAVLVWTRVSGSGETPAVPVHANLWIDANGGKCTFSDSPGPYDDATACPSTAAAYAVADKVSQSPVKVAIRAGRYGEQTIPDSSREGGYVTFVEDGGDVTFDSLLIYGDKTAWIGETIEHGLATEGSQGSRLIGARFEHVTARGGPGVGAWWIDNAQDLVFSDGEICCGESTAAANREGIRTGAGDPEHAVANLTIQRSDIHDWARDASLPHSECALLLSVQKLTIRGNHFWNCTVYSISLGRLGTDLDPKDTLIEGNRFEPSDNQRLGDQAGFNNIVLDHVGVRFDKLEIRHNSFSQPIQVETGDVPDATGFDRTTIAGNVIPDQHVCAPPGTTPPVYTGNVMTAGATCGTGAIPVASPVELYRSHGKAGTWDFRLRPGAPAAKAGAVR